MLVYYRNRETDKIEAKYNKCDTNSTLFRNKELYERFVSEEDLPIEVTVAPSPPPPKTELELRVEALEAEVYAEHPKESWIDKLRRALPF